MGLGELTRQLAKEAIATQVDEVVDSMRTSEPSKADAAPGESLAAVIVAQVQAMQNALKDHQELLVFCTVGHDTVRVFEMFAPSPRLLVLTGIDADRAMTRVVSPADTVQLVCKPAQVKEGAKPVRLRFVAGTPAKGG